MHNFKLYRHAKELDATCECSIGDVKKIRTANDLVFLLTDTNELFLGITTIDQSDIQFHFLHSNIIDVDCSLRAVYIVDTDGCVQRCSFARNVSEYENQWEIIPVIVAQPTFHITSQTNFSCDKRLWKEIGDQVRIVKVFCNADGALLLSAHGDLYGMGNIPDVCISDEPILIPFFMDYETIQVAAGRHFFVVLTRSRQMSKRSTSSESVNHDSLSLNSLYSISTTASEVNRNGDPLNVSLQFIPNDGAGSSTDVESSHDLTVASLSVRSSQETLNTVENPVQLDNVSIKTIENDGAEESCSSDNASIGADIEIEIAKLLQLGNELIRTQVWCFGTVNKGQLGTGDHIRRKLVSQVASLCEQGVQKICCGDEHTAVLTVDGRLYLWGDNANEQISYWLEKGDYSSPRRYNTTGQNILDVSCGQFSTFILTNSLERFELSRNKHFASIPLTNSKTDPLNAQQANLDGIEPSKLQFLAHGSYLLIGESNSIKLRFEDYLKFEQEYLQDILQKVAPFFPRFLRTMHRNVVKHPALYKEFFNQYNHIISITAANVEMMNMFGRGKLASSKLCFIRHALEYITVYRTYIKCYCEILCSDDYKRMCDTILPNTDFEAKFSTPLHHVCNYIAFAVELSSIDTAPNIKTAQIQWEQFKCEIDAMLDSAEQTVQFWRNHAKLLPSSLHTPERRFILDSRELPLKLVPSSRFTSQWFILFNDIFCVSTSSSSVKKHALETLWVCSTTDKEVTTSMSLAPSITGSQISQRFALELITPEERFVVSAQSLDAKFKWLDAIERHIRISLGKSEIKSVKVPAYRTATYTFSDKHKLYPKCRYSGSWFAGQIHGNGYLEYPDGRLYTGQFSNGIISGYGRSIIPGVTCYEGLFNAGKYNGQGTLEIQNHNGTYEGSFRNGQQHGHGILINNHVTYIGGFAGGVQDGYGVLDNSHTGEKYMGIFVDNKRSGHGFCITDDGQYFEGIFVDDELCGTGVAVFTDGSYYEGDLTMHGPNGRGTLYLPQEPIRAENSVDLDESKLTMKGNTLSGTLSGTWANVKIVNGLLNLNQQFPKYSRLAGITETETKWHLLFKDWEQDVFGMNAGEIVDNKKIWSKISAYIRNTKQNEQLKMNILSTNDLLENPSMAHELDDRRSFLNAPRTSANNKGISKSFSLSRITGVNYKRNIMAIERHKSISNEVLMTNYLPTDDVTLECNNNTDHMSALLLAGQTSVPCFGVIKLDKEDMIMMRDYLTKAFKSSHHPLGVLNAKISYCFYTSYGCWKVKPIAMLATQAMKEWERISKRIYEILKKLFPTLPSEYGVLDDEFISHRTLLYPILLSEGIYSTLFVLYANKCSQRDEIYRQRILVCDKKTDQELIEFLRISSNYIPMIQNSEFEAAINSLKQVKEKFCPCEMLKLIEMTFKHVEKAADTANTSLNILSSTVSSSNAIPPIVMLNADTMMPLTIYLILRAAIPHLGTEILLLEDLLGTDFEMLMHGFAGYCFTTIKAAYQHIINDQFFQQP